jgi:hypothetical protein
MRKNIAIAAILLFIFAPASTVFSESGSSDPALNLGILMLQQQLKSMQMMYSDPNAADSVEAAGILDSWSGKSPTMTPTGTCTTTNVVVTIQKQCGKLIKGYIKALGVQVPVEGSFASNALYLIGYKTGTTSWVASILGQYSSSTDSFTVQFFSFQKAGDVSNNVYDTGWKLSRN